MPRPLNAADARLRRETRVFTLTFALVAVLLMALGVYAGIRVHADDPPTAWEACGVDWLTYLGDADLRSACPEVTP